MATTTANLRLTKPLGAERYDINVFNNNADLIDAGFHAASGHDHSGRAGEGPQLTDAALAEGAVTTAKLALDTFHAEQFHNALPNGDFESWSAGADWRRRTAGRWRGAGPRSPARPAWSSTDAMRRH